MKTLLRSLFLILALTLGTVPAGASGGVSNSPNIHLRNGSSTNWSGYATETSLTNPQSNAVSTVAGTWTVPAVSCTATDTYSSVWVGIDGYSNGTVEQTGTEQDCRGGLPVYYAWYEMYPKFGYRVSLAVKPGDVIRGSVAYTGKNAFTLTLQNLTTGASYSTVQRSPQAQRQSAEWIAEAPSSSGGVLPLANFGTTQISNATATINGVSGTISSWAFDPITMVTSTGVVKAVPSSLSGGGTTFSVAWQHN